jgi:hypothetical protein
VADLRRIAFLSLLSVPVAAEMVLGELLFVGHVVFLVHALGFVLGLVAFIVIWAALGLAILTIRDTAWSRLQPTLERLRAGMAHRLADLLGQTRVRVLLAVLGAAIPAAVVAAVVVFAGGWLGDHRGDVLAFFIAAAVVLAVLLVMARVGRSVERWVRSAASAADPATRSLAVLVTMAVVGPALGWFLFRLLGYSGRTVYALTVLSAPVFGAVWVPVYAIGVWALLEGMV